MMIIRITAILNTISAYWHMVGVVFIVVVLIIVPDNHQSLRYVFTETRQHDGLRRTATTGFREPRLLVRLRRSGS